MSNVHCQACVPPSVCLTVCPALACESEPDQWGNTGSSKEYQFFFSIEICFQVAHFYNISFTLQKFLSLRSLSNAGRGALCLQEKYPLGVRRWEACRLWKSAFTKVLVKREICVNNSVKLVFSRSFCRFNGWCSENLSFFLCSALWAAIFKSRFWTFSVSGFFFLFVSVCFFVFVPFP